MANIGKRVVEIVLKATDDTTGAFSGLTKKIVALGKEFPALGVLAGLGFGKIIEWAGNAAQAIQQAVEANIKLGASFDDMSKRTDMSVDSLVRWDYIARLNGATIEEFEGTFKKLRKSIADAVNGNQEAIRSFGVLGVEFKDADGGMRNLEQTMLDVGQAVRKYGVESLQGAAAQDVLGRNSAAVVAVISQQRNELEFAAREADIYTGNMTAGWAAARAAADDASERLKIFKENLAAAGPSMTGFKNFWNEFLLAMTNAEGFAKLQMLEADRAKAAGTAVVSAYVDALVGEIGSAGPAMADELAGLRDMMARLDISTTVKKLDKQTLELVDVPLTKDAAIAAIEKALNEAVDPASIKVPEAEIPVKVKVAAEDPFEDLFGSMGTGEEVMLLEDFAEQMAMLRTVQEEMLAAGTPPIMDAEAIAAGDEALKRLIDSVDELTFDEQAAHDAAMQLVNGLGSVASQGLQAFMNGTQQSLMFGRMIREVVIKAVADLIVQLTIVKGLMKLFSFIPGFKDGGTVPQMALGGSIPRAAMGYAVPDGPRGMDSRLIMAMPGEEVINRNLSRRLDRFIAAYEFGAATSPFSLPMGGGRGQAVIQFNVGRPVSVLDGLAYGEAAVVASRKYQEAAL